MTSLANLAHRFFTDPKEELVNFHIIFIHQGTGEILWLTYDTNGHLGTSHDMSQAHVYATCDVQVMDEVFGYATKNMPQFSFAPIKAIIN